jgi:hypothetical protein
MHDDRRRRELRGRMTAEATGPGEFSILLDGWRIGRVAHDGDFGWSVWRLIDEGEYDDECVELLGDWSSYEAACDHAMDWLAGEIADSEVE